LAAGQQKQSINHAGKETNALRRRLAATSFRILGGALRAFAPQMRSDLRGSNRRRPAAFSQAVDATYKR
jgi:hypothetical protein